MRIKKPSKQKGRYIPLEDLKEIDDAFLGEMKRIKSDLDILKDKDVIDGFFHVILNAYYSEIEFRMLERETDYAIRLAEIKERERNIKPFRHCWLWRLIFQPLTNRAQDIIEERAALDANIKHTADEKAIDDDKKKLPADGNIKLSKRKLKRKMRDKLKAIINTADTADVREAFEEPQNTGTPETEQKQLHGQLSIDDVQPVQNVPTRRPRPPRSCRRA